MFVVFFYLEGKEMKRIDENYFKVDDGMEKNEIEDILSPDEHILWREKPNKKAYIWSRVFTMFPIALIWLVIDGTFIGVMFGTGIVKEMSFGLVLGLLAFFMIHMTPVWIWLVSIILGAKEHKNIEYAFTEKRIIIRKGIIGIDFKNIYYTDVQSVNLKVGLTDKIFHVGDVYIKANHESVVLFDIKNPYEITTKLQKITLDIKTDIYYPNALRPDENPGYNTKYKGDK